MNPSLRRWTPTKNYTKHYATQSVATLKRRIGPHLFGFTLYAMKSLRRDPAATPRMTACELRRSLNGMHLAWNDGDWDGGEGCNRSCSE